MTLELRPDWFAYAFEIPVLAVLPNFQRQGVGRALLERLLADRVERTAVLTVLEDVQRAVDFYRNLGWMALVEHFQFGARTPRYTLLGRSLRTDVRANDYAK